MIDFVYVAVLVSSVLSQSQVHAFISTSNALRGDSSTALDMSPFAQSIRERLDWKNTNAAKSNGIYMDPASTKIANIEISWEPDMALKIEALQKEREDAGITKPLMVGVVGIPGSGVRVDNAKKKRERYRDR